MAVVGLSDTVIVQTPQITLVCPVDQAERIKELVAEVTERLGRDYPLDVSTGSQNIMELFERIEPGAGQQPVLRRAGQWQPCNVPRRCP